MEHFDLCVMIPCYNNKRGLLESVQSVSCERRVVILVIDDGSNCPLDESEIRSVTRHSVVLIHQNANWGIVDALNTGLGQIGRLFTCTYIARLDCSDICRKDRFDKQLSELDNDPELIMVASWCLFFDRATLGSFIFKTPTRHREILKSLNFRNVFVHPSVVWRVTDNTNCYSRRYPHAEDYALFYKMCSKGKVSILPYTLVFCELNSAGISSTFRRQQLKSREKVIKEYSTFSLLKGLGILKLRVLRFVPFRLMVKFKMLIYRNRNPVLLSVKNAVIQ